MELDEIRPRIDYDNMELDETRPRIDLFELAQGQCSHVVHSS